MVYDWEDKQETCFRMYVIERRSLDDVMKFFKDEGTHHDKHYCATLLLATLDHRQSTANPTIVGFVPRCDLFQSYQWQTM